jgi:hypothetical protein
MSRVRMQGCGKADVGRLRQSPGDTLRIRRVRRSILQTLRVRDLNKNAPRLGAKKWFLNTIFYPMAALVVGDKCLRHTLNTGTWDSKADKNYPSTPTISYELSATSFELVRVQYFHPAS